MTEGMEFEDVFVEGTSYKVPRQVADEIINVRRGVTHEILDRIKLMEPGEEDTIIVVVPSNASSEFQMQVAQVTKQTFGGRGVAVVPSNLELHTQEGFKELVGKGMELAAAVEDNSPELAKKLAGEYTDLLSRPEEEESDAGT